MSTFAVIYRYVDDPAALDEVRPAHRAYLDGLAQAGSLAVSGPYVGGAAGALLIFTAADEEAARALTGVDPFVVGGLVTEITVREWNPVLGPLADSF